MWSDLNWLRVESSGGSGMRVNFFSGVRSRRLDISFILAVSCGDKQRHARCCSILPGV